MQFYVGTIWFHIWNRMENMGGMVPCMESHGEHGWYGWCYFMHDKIFPGANVSLFVS